jgi:hypothetical protein
MGRESKRFEVVVGGGRWRISLAYLTALVEDSLGERLRL